MLRASEFKSEDLGFDPLAGQGEPIPNRYTVTNRMISALSWASVVSHFNVSLIVQGKVTRQFTMFEEKGEPRRGVEPASFLPRTRLAP